MNDIGVNPKSDNQVAEAMRAWFARNERALRRTPLGDAVLAVFRHRQTFIIPEPAKDVPAC